MWTLIQVYRQYDLSQRGVAAIRSRITTEAATAPKVAGKYEIVP
jgi:hypothetical protein